VRAIKINNVFDIMIGQSQPKRKKENKMINAIDNLMLKAIEEIWKNRGIFCSMMVLSSFVIIYNIL
jgi:hypothetical protein